jgi:nucleotide-binding universal stress UspA family protein
MMTDLTRSVAQDRKPLGRLKIFLGAAPGVGKTYRMLLATQSARREGKHVVIGLIETHGRNETEALLAGLEVIPRHIIEYKGHRLEEMDIDAILRRRPGLAVVDELAHTNVPGSRNAKRYLDVQELINAGIDVFSTLNVQHIESLGDVVARITWSVVRETVPDFVLDSAEEIEVVDLTPAALVERLESGKVDVSKHPGQAIHKFFSQRNLTALRELALKYAKKPPVRRVLVPFDGSPSAFRAVDHVIALSRAGHHADVLLLNVQLAPVKAMAPSAAADLGSESWAAGEAILSEASRILERQHIPYQSEVVVGRPHELIIATAEQHHIDLIVMGSRGMGAVARLFLGSVATAVVQHAKVPVTVVK